jgi:hypothetical protein
MTFGILEGWYLQTPIAPEWILDLREIAESLIERSIMHINAVTQ